MALHYATLTERTRRSAATPAIWEFASPFAGRLTNVLIKSESAAQSAAAVFDVRVDGVSVFPVSAERPAIAIGAMETSVGSDVAVAAGDEILVDLVSVSGEGIGESLFAVLTLDDEAAPVSPLRSDALHTTASLSALAVESAALALGKTFLIQRVVTDRAARVRLYSTEDARTTDSSRAIGVDPTGEHGLIYEGVTTAENLVIDAAPFVMGANLDSPVTTNIYAAIQNLSGAAGTVDVTITRLVLET